MLDVQLKTENLSEAVRAVLDLPGLFRRARNSALRSLGYEVKAELQTQARLATKGGYLDWAPLHPRTPIIARARRSSGGLSWARTRWRGGARAGQVVQRKGTRTEVFSRLVGGIRYQVDDEDGLVTIGFVNPGARVERWLRMHAQGYETRVTPRKRRFLFAIGFPLKKETTVLRAPARPWVSKVYEHMRSQIHPRFEGQFWKALNRYREGGGGKN